MYPSVSFNRIRNFPLLHSQWDKAAYLSAADIWLSKRQLHAASLAVTPLGKKILHTATPAITSASNSRPHAALPLSLVKKWSPDAFPLTISLNKKRAHATSTEFLSLHWKLYLNKPRLHISLNTRENTNFTQRLVGSCYAHLYRNTQRAPCERSKNKMYNSKESLLSWSTNCDVFEVSLCLLKNQEGDFLVSTSSLLFLRFLLPHIKTRKYSQCLLACVL